MALSPIQYRKAFVLSEAATEVKLQLQEMEDNPQYVTKASYSPSSESDISFSEKHFTYISTHPTVRPHEYMANLRLKTKLR
ncbi:MAG TPA: hypothetical protein VGE30_01250 [Candidatus Saccharimonadales bacterium]